MSLLRQLYGRFRDALFIASSRWTTLILALRAETAQEGAWITMPRASAPRVLRFFTLPSPTSCETRPRRPAKLRSASSGGASGLQASRTWRLRRSVRLGSNPSLRFTFAFGSVGVPSNPQRRKCRVARFAWLDATARPLVVPSSTIPMRTSQIRSGTHAVDGWTPRRRPASANQVRRRERRFRVPEGSGPTGRRRAPSAPRR